MTKQKNKKKTKTVPKVKLHPCPLCLNTQISSQAICLGCSRRVKGFHKNKLGAEEAFWLECLRAQEYRDIKGIGALYAQKMRTDE